MVNKQITLSKALEGYFLAAHARRLSAGTLTDYDNTFRKFERFLGHDPPLEAITADQIRAFLNSLHGLTDKSVLNHHVGLSALWTWAVREGLVEHHILRNIDPPKPEQRDIVPYTEGDIKAMLAACDRSRAYTRPGKRKCNNRRPTAQRDRAILTLLVDTGIRATELCNLRLADVDLANQRIRVMGKGKKERVLPIVPRTAQVLWRYLATRDDTDSDTAPLFLTGRSLPLSRHALLRVVTRIGDRAKVLGANVHRFRHTFAIEFLRNNGNVFALQRMLGHSSMTMVQRYLAIAQADIDAAHRQASPVANWLL